MARPPRPRTIEDIIDVLQEAIDIVENVIANTSTGRKLPLISELEGMNSMLDGLLKKTQRLVRLRESENVRIIIVDRETGAKHEMTSQEIAQHAMNYAGHDVLYMLHHYKVVNDQWVPLTEQEKDPQ